jgi:4-hydroxybenzoate polyprenyltransferase/phosphoserine phosphatase
VTTVDRAPRPVPTRVPVYVDLDGTLIRSDLLWESLCDLARERPAELLRTPAWLLGGKASFKRRIAERVDINPVTLPYREEVLDYLRAERAAGRPIVLATASDAQLALPIAEHLALFDDVLASDGETNLSSTRKLAAIEAHRQEVAGSPGEFEYIGNSRADLPIWQAATGVTLVAPTRAALAGVRGSDHRLLVPPTSSMRAAVSGLRLFQWAKNGLLFVPLLLAHQLNDMERVAHVVLAFLSFSGVASASYLLNDLLDIEADRQHPSKSSRPFAAGTLPIPAGLILIAALLLVSTAIAASFLPMAFGGMLLAYLALTLSYSFYFKQQLFIDVLVLAGLYTHRVLTGGVAADVPVSPWILAFSAFFFLSLALAKRYVELGRAREAQREGLRRRAYQVGDLELVQTMGLSAGYIGILVLCLFISSDDVSRLYATPMVLWLMCPVMLYWISRVWLLARRGELHDDPVVFSLRDLNSWICGALVLAVLIGATL